LRVKRRACVDENDLAAFERTIGPQRHLSDGDYREQWSIASGNVVALIGAGHFVATYRRSVFEQFIYKPRRLPLKGGLTEIEARVDELGFSRLSCVRNHVRHMGNVWEDWMSTPEPNVSMTASRPVELGVRKKGTWARWIPGAVRAIGAYFVLAFDRVLERGMWNMLVRRFVRTSIQMRS
jgi:hypothetical protein